MASGLRQYYSAFSVLLNFVASFAYLENDLSAVLSNFVNMNKTKERCWGFEADCPLENSYSRSHVKCLQRSRWPEANTEPKQVELFWKAGDFGSLKTRHSSIATICNSTSEVNRIFKTIEPYRYRTDVIGKGEAGGNCDFIDKQLLQTRADERGYLRSWADELIHFESYPEFNMHDPTACDVVFEKPTVIIKLDAAVNMYHHFCDFVNLFASQFLNSTNFGQDVEIFWWDTHHSGFVDSTFGVTWKAFSFHKPHELVNYDGKKVCFRNAMLPLLARQLFGLYYNMPLVDGCQGSGLFHAFSHHILHRLGVKQDEWKEINKVRITLLVRDTPFRKILNINELLQSLLRLKNVEAKIVNYERNGGLNFLEQLKATHNSDIFIGMHGSGLTHLLFLPDWAAVFEIYNCEDPNCYKDLARLRGVKYWTWANEDKVFPESIGLHPTMKTPHKKFTDYSFDVPEFLRIAQQMIEYVRRHPSFVERQRQLRRQILENGNQEELVKAKKSEEL